MKDLKIQNISSVTESIGPQKSNKQENIAGPSFNETLQNTVARMNDLKIQADAVLDVKDTKAATIKDEISSAREIFDKMMLEKKNLSQLYHHMKNDIES